MDTNTIIGLIGAFGIGTLANTIVSHWQNKSKEAEARMFEEKKEAYRNLLKAIHDIALKRTEETRRNYGLKQAELMLVGSPTVVKLSDDLRKIDSNSKEHLDALELLFLAMREDLGIDTRRIRG